MLPQNDFIMTNTAKIEANIEHKKLSNNKDITDEPEEELDPELSRAAALRLRYQKNQQARRDAQDELIEDDDNGNEKPKCGNSGENK